MLGLNPVGPMGITKFGSFDFPVGLHADPPCKGNVDPGTPHVELWYGKLGSPPREQGWPCIMESCPEAEDPKVNPWIDLMLDIDQEAVLYNTGRLSGSMVVELADDTHTSVVTAHAVPYKKSGSPIRIYYKEQPLTPPPDKKSPSDVWFWHSDRELIYTMCAKFKPTDLKFTVGEVYKLLVEWEFYHTIPGTGRKHLEPFAGFCDSVTFKVLGATTV